MGKRVKFKFNVKKNHTDMRTVRKNVPMSLAGALYLECNIEMTEMKKVTPVWNPARKVPKGHAPGSLRASGRVSPPMIGKHITCVFSFGNQIVDYALYVHEDYDAFHATGDWNFMRGPLEESAPYFPERIASHLQGNLLRTPISVTVNTWELDEPELAE